MAELDPYLVLGVARTASRDEIARTYRRLAKQHHPDAGAPPSRQMARINEAWFVLSDRTRRARWDAAHGAVQPAHWAGRAGPPTPTTTRPTSTGWAAADGPFAAPAGRRPPPPPTAPASVRESPWFAFAAVAGAVGIVGLVMVLIGLVAAGLPGTGGPFGGSARTFSAGDVAFAYPEGWNVYPGEDAPVADGAGHAILAHVTNFDVRPGDRCTAFTHPCRFTRFGMPIGAVSVVVSEFRSDAPPLGDEGVGEAVVDRGFGSTVMRWQLRADAADGRWVTVEAVIGVTGARPTEAETTVGELVASMTIADASAPGSTFGETEQPAP